MVLYQARLEAINARNQLLNFQELDSLLTAIKAGHKLKSINFLNELQGNAKIEISIALQSIVYKIRELQTLKGHSDSANSIAFSPDGKTIATGSRDNTVKLWNLDFDDLMAQGCAWLRDYLVNNPNATDEEREACQVKR